MHRVEVAGPGSRSRVEVEVGDEGAGVGLFGRGTGRRASARAGRRAGRKADREAVTEAEQHLAAFAASRRGVEAFVEPETPTTPTTLVLVASDGEWTRRRAGSAKDAFTTARRLGVPVYDVAATGYPSRMREWTARQRKG